ncbi:MAG: hypothetical protein ABSE56_02410 [Bryobacteraceae bacterium]|jgi:hypothetical protein
MAAPDGVLPSADGGSAIGYGAMAGSLRVVEDSLSIRAGGQSVKV